MIDQELQSALILARSTSSPQDIVDLIPYSRFIGAQAKVAESGVLYLSLIHI